MRQCSKMRRWHQVIVRIVKSLREREAAQIFMLISKYLNFKHNTQIYFPIEEFYDRNNRSCLSSEQCWRKELLDDCTGNECLQLCSRTVWCENWIRFVSSQSKRIKSGACAMYLCHVRDAVLSISQKLYLYANRSISSLQL